MLSSLKEKACSVPPIQWRRVTIAVIAVLLTAHVCWIGVHLWLVKNGRINPWKLGGYGMYTVPHLNSMTHVFVFDKATNGWKELSREQLQFDSYVFNASNDWHVFRCRPIDAESLTAFLERNNHLRYRSLLIAITETRFDRYPIKITREAVQQVEIGWGGKNKFGFRGKACGETYSGESTFNPSN